MRKYDSRHERELALAAGALIAAAGLAVLAVKLDGAPPTALDSRIQRGVLRSTTKRGRKLGRIISRPGYPAIYFPATALLIAALRRRGARGSDALIIASLGGWATHRFIKLFANRRRPRSMKGRANELEAFPSGHTTASTAIAMTAAYVLARQRLVPLPVAIAIGGLVPATIGAGRVLSDEHWATDVIGGWIGGAGIAALAAAIFERV
jgi:membrane-associated phospholipid phosphatase